MPLRTGQFRAGRPANLLTLTVAGTGSKNRSVSSRDSRFPRIRCPSTPSCLNRSDRERGRGRKQEREREKRMGEVVCARARQRDEASERASARKRETEDTYTYTDRQIDRYTDRARENEAQVGVSGELKNSGMSVGYCTLCSSILCPGSYQSLPPPIACSRKSSFLILAATQSCTGDSMA
jgi:hypothetical protein